MRENCSTVIGGEYDRACYPMLKPTCKPLATVLAIPAMASVLCIRIYQRTISPDHGWMRHLYRYGYCRHEPTCSQYAIDQLKIRSFPVALWRIMKRILSCHPWKKISDERLKKAVQRELRM